MSTYTFSLAPDHPSSAPLDSGIRGWPAGTLASALSAPERSQAGVPHEWHISPDPLATSSPLPSPPPSSPFSTTSSHSLCDSSTPTSPAPTSPRSKPITTPRKSAKSPGRIPRPSNAFMIYRSEESKKLKELGVERDHRQMSKIIGHMWNGLDAATKAHYQQLAVEQKREHATKYPNYRFSPQQRTQKPKKRNVKRNGAVDRQRCTNIAALRLGGKDGDALKAEVEEFDRANSSVEQCVVETEEYSTGVYDPRTWMADSRAGSEASSSATTSAASSPLSSASSRPARLRTESPVFCDLLLPPSDAHTPALRSPLEMPEMASLSTFSPPSAPYTPVDSQAPTIPSVPLPHVAEQNNFHLAAGYQQSYPSSSAAGLGLEMDHPQPQGQLGLIQPHTPRTAAFMLPAQEQQYASGPYNFPPGASYPTSYPPPMAPNYYLPDYAIPQGGNLSWAPGPAAMHYNPMGMPYAPDCGPLDAQTGLRRADQWPFNPASALQMNVPAQPQASAGWMAY